MGAGGSKGKAGDEKGGSLEDDKVEVRSLAALKEKVSRRRRRRRRKKEKEKEKEAP